MNAIRVQRLLVNGSHHVYVYGDETTDLGHFTVDVDLRTIYSSGSGGAAEGGAHVALDTADAAQGDLTGSEYYTFIRATVGVRKQMKEGGPPQDTAHRYFY